MSFFSYTRTVLLGLLLVWSITEAPGQIPRTINYQGALSQNNNDPVPDAQYRVTFRIYDAATAATELWSEQQVVVTFQGVFDAILGNVTPFDIPFDKPYWLGVTIEGQSEMQPRVPLVSVPFALSAMRAAFADSAALASQARFSDSSRITGHATTADTALIAREIAPDARGVVLSLNDLQGKVTLVGEGGTTINASGNTLRIRSTGNGISTITSNDGSIKITLSASDIDLSLADSSVTAAKVKNGSITAEKLAPGVLPTSLSPSGAAGGDLSGTYPNPLIRDRAITTTKLADKAVTGDKLEDITTAGTFGNATTVPQITIDAKGRVATVQNVPISATNLTTAGGDLSGQYPNPTIAQKGAASGQVLKWNGSAWIPANDDGQIYIAGKGIDIIGNTISNTGDADSTNDITTSTTAAGDVSGVFNNLKVERIQNRGVAASAPTNGQVLQYNTTTNLWEPSTINTGSTGVAGGDLSGTYPNPTIAQKGATAGQVMTWNGSEWLPLNPSLSGTAGGDLAGTYPAPTIAQKGATTNQVLKWNGTAWMPANDDGQNYTAGTGISIAAGVVSNTGDTDPSNDITNTTSAGGDLAGTYPAPTIAQKGATTNQVLKWNGSAWMPANDDGQNYTAGTGINIAAGVVSNTGDTDPSNDITNTTSAGGDLAGTYPAPTIAQKGATTNQVLKWNGTAWMPANDDGQNYTAGTGINIAAGVVSNTGDTDPSNDITNTTSAGGDLAGTYPAPTIAQKGATTNQVLKWNGSAWMPANDDGQNYTAGTGINIAAGVVTNTGDTDPSNDITNTTSAGGDLAGTYPAPTIAQKGATTNQVLKWNGTAWMPANDDGQNYTAGTGINIAAGVVTNTGDTDPSNDITNTTSAGGDLAGTYPAPTIAQKGATTNQVLKWNGSAWMPANDDGQNYTAGTGINIAAGVVSNTGDTDPSNDITNTTSAGGDLTGTYPAPTIAQKGATTGQSLVWNGTAWNPASVTATGSAGGDLAGTYPAPTIAQKGATNNQVLKWNGTAWMPANDDGQNYTAGTGINIAAGVVSNTGDTDPSNDITNTTSAGGDLTGTYPAPTIAQKGATTGQALVWNGTAWNPASVTATGSAGGDLAGTYPAPTIAQKGATTNQVLKWNGTAWMPANDDGQNYTAGTGINIAAGVVSNTGDTDPSNDITNTTSAGGDLAGTYPAPTIAQKGATTNQVLKWNGSAWMPANDDGQNYTAGTGINIAAGVVTNTGDTDPSNDITNTTSAGGDLAGTYPAPTIAQKGATTNQVLKWNGSAWMPANDDGQNYTAGTGINIAAGVVTNTGDTDPSNDITNTTSAGGDLAGTYPAPTIAQKGATTNQVLKWNGSAWMPANDDGQNYTAGTGINIAAGVVSNTGDTDPSNDITNTTSAGGDLAGTYPAPTIAQKGATTNQVLKWNGSAWMPANDDGQNYTAGTGINIAAGVVTNTGDTDPSNDITNTTSAGGDLAGTYPAPTIAQKGATTNQVLKWNGSAWMPANDDGQNYTAGTGISIAAGVVSNTGDTDPSNDITNTTSAGGDLAGTYPAPTIAQKGATTNQVLKWNGTAWMPANDDGQNYTAGTGISIAAGVVTNTGDTDPSNDITNTTSAGGDLAGTYPAPTIAQKGATTNQVLKWNGSAWMPANDDGQNYTAGTGINIAAGVVTNTGDTDPSNDITNTTSAGGDLAGTYPAPTIAQKGATTGQALVWNGTAWNPASVTATGSAGGDLAGTYPAPTIAQKGATTNQVLKWNGSAWMPANDDGQNYTAGTGINIAAGVVSNTGDTDPSNDITNTTSAGGDLAGTYPAPTIAQKGATTNQVLKWNGTAWMPANDDGQNYTAGTGINIAAGVVTNTGDTDPSNDITNTTSAGGDLAGTYPAPTIAQKGATNGQALVWNGTAWNPASVTATGSAGGDLAGTYPAPTIAQKGATNGQVLAWNGTAWNPITPTTSGAASGDLAGTYPAPTIAQKGATNGQVLAWNGAAWNPITPTTSGAAGGDLSGTYPNPTVSRIQNRDVSGAAPTTGQALVWSGAAWIPTTITASGSAGGDLAGTYPAPTIAQKGATTGQALVWNGSAWNPATISASGTAGGDLSGTYPNPNVVKLQNRTVASTAPTNGQVLKWNNSSSQWEPANDAGGSGDVTGPASSLDNAIARYDGITGKIIQNSAIVLDDTVTVGSSKIATLKAEDGITSSISLVLAPKSGGALIADKPDGAIAGGSERGLNAVDLQMSRTNSDQVASGSRSVIGGGEENRASGGLTAILGGEQNVATGLRAVVVGGLQNTASGDHSVVAGGAINTATGPNSFIGSGSGNNASSFSVVGGGMNNRANNTITTIPGGSGLTLNGNRSFGINANSSTDSAIVSASDIAYFGNMDMWLGNTDNSASELRFYEAQAADGTFPAAGTNYTALKAGTQTADITWTLPITTPTTNQVLTATGVSGNNVTLGWSSTSGAVSNLIGFTASQDSSAPLNNLRYISILQASGSSTSIDIALSPKNGGALAAGAADGSIQNGNKRGTMAVDWQISRVSATQVASGDRSVIGGGHANTVSGIYSTIAGGYAHLISGSYSAVGGGIVDTIQASHSFIGAGENNKITNTADWAFIGAGSGNTASNSYSVIAGGLNNTSSNQHTFVGGGSGNTASNNASVVAGGTSNRASGPTSFIGGGSNNLASVSGALVVGGSADTASGSFAVIVGGQNNKATATQAFIGGGVNNVASGNAAVVSGGSADTASAIYATVSGGNANKASANYATVAGGATNKATGLNSTISGGTINTASSANATVSGGFTNTVSGFASAIGGGYTNTVSGDTSAIAGGISNSISGDGSFIGGGTGNSITSDRSTIGGGSSNSIASGNYATIAGGNRNSVNTIYSTIGGGSQNYIANGIWNTIAGGVKDTIQGAGASYSAIAGGTENAINISGTGASSFIASCWQNKLSGRYSTILGGAILTLSGDFSNAYYGNDNSGRPMSVSADSITLFANTNMWLGGNDNKAKELRFYEAQNTTGAFPAAGTNYTAFKAGVQSADVTYTLPTAAPTSNGQVLSSTTAGVMSWINANSGGVSNLIGFTASQDSTSPINNTRYVSILQASGTATDIDIALTPKGAGALTAQKADNAVAGGNKRGQYAVDWQLSRTAANQVASGSYSSILSGDKNRADSLNSVVVGGSTNSNRGIYSTIENGYSNVIEAGIMYDVIHTGYTNTIFKPVNPSLYSWSASISVLPSNFSTIVNGATNEIRSYGSLIGSGLGNKIYSDYYGIILTGTSSLITGFYDVFIGVGQSDTVKSSYTFVGSGSNQKIDTLANYSFIGAGNTMSIGNSSGYSFMGAGGNLSIANNSPYGFIGSGYNHSIKKTSPYGFIGGGFNNIIDTTAEGAVIVGGYQNTIARTKNSGVTQNWNYSGIVTGYGNKINGWLNFIGAGWTDTISTIGYSTILSGNLNKIDAVSDQYDYIGNGYNNKITNASYSNILNGYNHVITVDYSTIGSGYNDTIVGQHSIILAGHENYLSVAGGFIGTGLANKGRSQNGTIINGNYNIVDTLAAFSIVGNGQGNNIDSAISYSVIPSGYSNTMPSNGYPYTAGNEITNDFNFIGTGYGNSLKGIYSVIGNGQSNVMDSVGYSMIGTGYANRIKFQSGGSFAHYSMIAAGELNLLQGHYGFMGAGYADTVIGDYNTIVNSRLSKISGVVYSGIVSGFDHTISGDYAFVGGGNTHTISGDTSTIAGGSRNSIVGINSFIGGGSDNDANGSYNVIAGGNGNSTASSYNTITGGYQNSTTNSYATVGGGYQNRASGFASVVGGGYLDTASGSYSVVAGGYSNNATSTYATVLGGNSNTAGASYAAVLNGLNNTASASYAVILGGNSNTANAQYNLVFGEDVDPSVTETHRIYLFDATNWGKMAFNRENVPSSDVWTIGTAAGGNGNGARLTTGGVWTDASSYTLKDRFITLNANEVLTKVSSLDLRGWHYKGLNEFHISPFAEDFFSAFGTGTLDNPDNNKTLAALDVAGVALYSSQQLIKQNEQQENRIKELESKNALLEERLKRVESHSSISAPATEPASRLSQSAVRIVSIVPDPASSTVVVKFALDIEGAVTLNVVTSSGELRSTALDNVRMNRGSYEVEVSVQDFTNGWYIANLRVDSYGAQRLFRVIH